LKAKSPVRLKNSGKQTFLQRIDLFLGHLKTFFEPKPGFFVHDLLFVILALKELYNLWSAGNLSVRNFLAMSRSPVSPDSSYIIMLGFNFFSFAIEIFLTIQLWKFIRKTKTSLLIFATVSWAAIFTSLFFFIMQYISSKISDHNGFQYHFDAGTYFLYLLPWLLFYGFIIYLCSRKKIIVMHKVTRRNFLFTPLYGLLWMIGVQGIQFLVALIFNLTHN
jgi:hypothetical protein